jgi:hypothetical protein
MPSFKILTPDRYILHTYTGKEKENTLITTAINTENLHKAGGREQTHRLGESGETYCRSCQAKQQNKRQPNQVLSLSLSLSPPNLRLHIPSFLSFPVVDLVCVILVDLCLDSQQNVAQVFHSFLSSPVEF